MAHKEFDDPHRSAAAPVVIGVDGSAGSARALAWAAGYAAQRQRELQIVYGMDLVSADSVFGSYAVISPPVIDTVRAHGRAVLARAQSAVREAQPDLRISTFLSSDTGAGTLIERSRSAFAVVIGETGQTSTLRHLGSTLFALTSHARGAVIVVRPDPDAGGIVRTTGPVVVGVDGSPTGEAAIAAAFAEASERRTGLVAVHVWSDWGTGQLAGEIPAGVSRELHDIETVILAERLAGWQEKYPDVEVTREVHFSGPAQRLRDLSATAQLVVVGNRGRGGFVGMLLGSTTHSLVQHAHCPVMVVHNDTGADDEG